MPTTTSRFRFLLVLTAAMAFIPSVAHASPTVQLRETPHSALVPTPICSIYTLGAATAVNYPTRSCRESAPVPPRFHFPEAGGRLDKAPRLRELVLSSVISPRGHVTARVATRPAQAVATYVDGSVAYRRSKYHLAPRADGSVRIDQVALVDASGHVLRPVGGDPAVDRVASPVRVTRLRATVRSGGLVTSGRSPCFRPRGVCGPTWLAGAGSEPFGDSDVANGRFWDRVPARRFPAGVSTRYTLMTNVAARVPLLRVGSSEPRLRRLPDDVVPTTATVLVTRGRALRAQVLHPGTVNRVVRVRAGTHGLPVSVWSGRLTAARTYEMRGARKVPTSEFPVRPPKLECGRSGCRWVIRWWSHPSDTTWKLSEQLLYRAGPSEQPRVLHQSR